MATIDVEDESILVSVFKDSFAENWRNNPDFATYLSELCSFGVEKLNREPERLEEERAQILQQTRELAFSNYKTFIRTAECTEQIYRDFSRVEDSLAKLLDKLPSFGEKCRFVLTRPSFTVKHGFIVKSRFLRVVPSHCVHMVKRFILYL